MTSKTSTVDAIKPKQMLMAIGISTWACRLRSNINGSKPAIVVSEVIITARNLMRLARVAASTADTPAFRCDFRNNTNRIESLTTIPASEAYPIMLGRLRF